MTLPAVPGLTQLFSLVGGNEPLTILDGNFNTLSSYITANTPVSVKLFGAVGDDSHDDTDALSNAWAAAQTGVPIYFPVGVYQTTAALSLTTYVAKPITLLGTPGARIRLMAKAGYSPDAVIILGSSAQKVGRITIKDLIFDANGNAPDALFLAINNGLLENVTAVNSTSAGFHCVGCQDVAFINPACSHSLMPEIWSQSPTYGFLFDTKLTSACLVQNPQIEECTGNGIAGDALINSTFISGTSETNGAYGISLGGSSYPPGLYVSNNSFINMDLEANVSGDVLLTNCRNNNFYGMLMGSTTTSALTCTGSTCYSNNFYGGIVAGINCVSGANFNLFDGVTLDGQYAVIQDTMPEISKNTFTRVFNNYSEDFADSIPTMNATIQLSIGTTKVVTYPTIAYASGFGTGPSIAQSSSSAFLINVGTTSGNTGVVTMPFTAPHAWAASAQNNTNNATKTVGVVGSATTLTFISYDRVTGLATNFTDNDEIAVVAFPA